MPRLYLSRLIGTGTRDDPYRSAVTAHPSRYRSLAVPVNPETGVPTRMWTLAEVEANDFAPIDANSLLALLEDKVNLDQAPSGGKRNAINNFLGQLGSTTTVVAGDTYRTIANKLLVELGTTERV